MRSNEVIGREAANACRKEWDLGFTPIGNLPKLIESRCKVGVALIHTDSPGHGMTMQLSDHTIMAVGCTPHPMRLQSTLAHELGHLRIGTVNRQLGSNGWEKRSPEEIQADSFARHFLLPAEALKGFGKQARELELSNLVQNFRVSPAIAAIQMRDSGLIDEQLCIEFGTISTKTLAAKFGWLSEYNALAAASLTPRPPQALMARAVEAYQWRQISASALARLQGEKETTRFEKALEQQGITPSPISTSPARPTPADGGLTPAEIEVLMNGET